MKFRLLAFFYALTVYLLLAGVGWLFLHRWSPVAEEAQSTRVTLVRPDEAEAEAKQAVNSEASRASKAEKEPPKEAVPTPPKPKETQEHETPPPPPKKEEIKKREAPRKPPPPPTRPDTPKMLALDAPAKRSVAVAKKVDQLPLKPLKSYELEQLKSLKRPLSESELASCCPAEPQKSLTKRKRLHRAKKSKHKNHTKSKRRSAKRSSRASMHSRARRGGSLSANRFLAKIKRRIARNKRYPPAARRRRLQGSVRVSFTVLPGGRVASISVRGPRAFAASARRAVREAFPVDVSRAGFSLPRRLSVTLRYRLR